MRGVSLWGECQSLSTSGGCDAGATGSKTGVWAIASSLAGVVRATNKTLTRRARRAASCHRIEYLSRHQRLVARYPWGILIPCNGTHPGRVLKYSMTHHSQAGLHSVLGPRVPEPPRRVPVHLPQTRHRVRYGVKLISRLVLRGLHRRYVLPAAGARPKCSRNTAKARLRER